MEIRTRTSMASQAFAALRSTWKSRSISTNIKIRLFKSNVLSSLLYGTESWKMTKSISHKLEVFQNRCLCRILNIFWPNTISNIELHRRTTTNILPKKSSQVVMDWPCSANVTYSPPQEERQTQRELEEDCREGYERTGVDLEIL